MDLSFRPLVGPTELAVLPADLAALMADITARQSRSTTAAMQAELSSKAVERHLFAPLDGAFNGRVAAAIIAWKEG